MHRAVSFRIVIVGGVAGGASCAARARRLGESAKITVIERGPYVSFANCGLPYHVGGVIPDEAELLLSSPEKFKERFDIDVRVNNEVVAIDRKARKVEVRNLETGETYLEPYDALVLATGASPSRPPIPGLDSPGVFTLRTVPDSRKLRAWIDDRKAKRAVVIGAGFVGLEVAENLIGRGLAVTVVELTPQVMPPLDPEMATPVAEHLEANGVSLVLGEGVERIEEVGDVLLVRTSGGTSIEADLVILGMGVRPNSRIAKEAGLAVGPTGGIEVDEHMLTSDPAIWSVGDVIQTKCAVTGRPLVMPLAGPANRQGRIAADNIFRRPAAFRGVQGTAVCGLFGLTVASTGVSAKTLRKLGCDDYHTVYLHPSDHVGYYPGASAIHMKLLYDAEGRVLGAQAVGHAGVEKRIDVIAMAIQLGAKVYDLEEAELCYAPQFGAAKDPVNVAGMIASNELRGDLPQAKWEDLSAEVALIDVREAGEFARGHVDGAINLPLSQLRDRLDELPRDRELWLYCKSGKRSYDATRALLQRGFTVRSLRGGMDSYAQVVTR